MKRDEINILICLCNTMKKKSSHNNILSIIFSVVEMTQSLIEHSRSNYCALYHEQEYTYVEWKKWAHFYKLFCFFY